VAGLVTSFGSGAMTNSITCTDEADAFFVIGTNTTENHPLIGTRIVERAAQGRARLVVADSRRIHLAEFADVFLQHKCGTDVALLNGLMNVIVSEGLEDKEFIAERTEDYEALKAAVAGYTPDRVAEITGVGKDDLMEAARIYASAGNAMIFYAMGITQHTTGVDNVHSCANLALLTGNLGRAGTGVNPLRGQNNVQGACDLGGLPNVYSGYQNVTDPDVRKKFEQAWGSELPGEVGLTVTEIIHAAGRGDVKGLYILGENPVLSDPDVNSVKTCLENCEFLVVQDIFLTETAQLADVVFPGACFAEKEGTFTNTDRTILRVRKAVDPPGEAHPDWQVICDVAKRFGCDGFAYESAADIMTEITRLTPSYGGISYERLDRGEILAWPCPDADSKGTTFLHQGRFPRGPGKFFAVEFQPPDELPDEEFPMVLTTGRTMFHFHTGTMTRRTAILDHEQPAGYVEMSPADAARLNVSDGDKVQVKSRRGAVETQTLVTERVPGGTVFMPFHFVESAANVLTNPALDPIAKIPELKVCAVSVSKVNSR